MVLHVASLSHAGPPLFVLRRLFMLHILPSSVLSCSTFEASSSTVSSPSPLCQSTILLSHFPQLRQ